MFSFSAQHLLNHWIILKWIPAIRYCERAIEWVDKGKRETKMESERKEKSKFFIKIRDEKKEVPLLLNGKIRAKQCQSGQSNRNNNETENTRFHQSTNVRKWLVSRTLGTASNDNNGTEILMIYEWSINNVRDKRVQMPTHVKETSKHRNRCVRTYMHKRIH